MLGQAIALHEALVFVSGAKGFANLKYEEAVNITKEKASSPQYKYTDRQIHPET